VSVFVVLFDSLDVGVKGEVTTVEGVSKKLFPGVASKTEALTTAATVTITIVLLDGIVFFIVILDLEKDQRRKETMILYHKRCDKGKKIQSKKENISTDQSTVSGVAPRLEFTISSPCLPSTFVREMHRGGNEEEQKFGSRSAGWHCTA
jgi:hypothetical protein